MCHHLFATYLLRLTYFGRYFDYLVEVVKFVGTFEPLIDWLLLKSVCSNSLQAGLKKIFHRWWDFRRWRIWLGLSIFYFKLACGNNHFMPSSSVMDSIRDYSHFRPFLLNILSVIHSFLYAYLVTFQKQLIWTNKVKNAP